MSREARVRRRGRRQGQRNGQGRRRRTRVAFSALAAVALACVTPWPQPVPVGYHRVAPVPSAGAKIGAARCYDCHASFDGHFVASDAHPDCESCHGPGEQHAYTARASDIRFPANADCAACHQVGSRTLLGWTTSPHARANMLCSDCHDTHGRALFSLREPDALAATTMAHAGATSRMCLGCHAEVRARLDLPSHHPIDEGMVGCTDCHGAHESRREGLGAPTRRCVSCHQEVAGPWIYEHPPVTEDCGYCHVPHGASADFLLEAPQPASCISCHTLPLSAAVHQPYAFTTACTDCHNAVHGSYSDPHLRN